MPEGILTLNPISPERDPEELGRPSMIEAPLGAGIGLALANKFKDRTFGPDADQIEKERKEIRELLKPGVSPEIEPPKPETFPSGILKPFKEELPIDTPKPYKESFPDQSEKINVPIITYSKDSPENLKDLVGRSVGQEKGEKAIEKLYDDSIFEGVLDSDQLSRMRQLEENYTGGLNDLGDAGIPVILENTMLDQHEEYMEDYKDALANAARETLGNEFKAYRLMEKDDAIRMLTEGEFPNIKRLQEDEEGNEVYKDIIIDMMGQETPLSREAFSFSLSPKEALSFRYLSAGGRRDKKDEDFVLIEMKASPTDIVMRGHESEKDLVLRVDGNVAGDRIVTPNLFNVYDIKYGDKNQVQLSENKEYKSFVDASGAKTKKPEAPALIGVTSQEGGKVIKDITAGVSAQKGDAVPSLLEQSKLAMPIKKFFEEDDQVVNYKIGDTVGAYGKDVERSLDIEANVKPNFNIDKFADVVKQRAKAFDQDAVFVAETVPKDSEGANVGFDIDFGSDLKMREALSVGNSISRIAELDGFTFKIKNLDTSGTSLYLPQTEKDLALIDKTLKRYPLTEDIRKAGFIMPDGKMLNFSLRGGNERDTEHRRVGFMVQEGYDGQDFGPMYDWMMRTGGVRVTGNQNRLFAELAGKPTTTQINKIVEEYNNNRDKYDSMIIAVTIPGEGGQGVRGPRQDFGSTTGLGTIFANDLKKATFRLPAENFYEITGENANASDIMRKLQSADVVGKTFTGIRQLNIPEFSNISAEEAFNKVGNLYKNMQEIIDSTNIKTLDKPKVKFYKTKVFTKGKDY